MANVIEKAKRAAMTRLNYPPGTRLVLDYMDEQINAVPVGTWGTVTEVDGDGKIQMAWDNMIHMCLKPDVDRFHRLTTQDIEERFTHHRDAVKSFMQSEEANCAIYPFGATYDELSEEQLQTIIKRCCGSLDAETISAAVESVVGKSPLQCSKEFNEKLLAKHQGQEDAIGGIFRLFFSLLSCLALPRKP